jgi:DNA polymerase elongation subunit (family B)
MKEVKKVENLKTEEKSNWGGLREGSGRKPKLQYEVREIFNKAIDDEWENIIKVLQYQIRRGDKDTMKWCIEQRIGKAPQSMDIKAQGAFLSVSEPITEHNGIDIDLIAKGVSNELRKLKTK